MGSRLGPGCTRGVFVQDDLFVVRIGGSVNDDGML